MRRNWRALCAREGLTQCVLAAGRESQSFELESDMKQLCSEATLQSHISMWKMGRAQEGKYGSPAHPNFNTGILSKCRFGLVGLG